MTWWLPHKFDEKRGFLDQRMTIIKTIRQFFDVQDFYEAQTPVLQYTPVMDAHIHGFETLLWGHDLKPKATKYLHTSPEFDMKKLMVAGLENLYQICPVFRNGEGSSLHSPEFTMLEWYRVRADYNALMDDCVALLQAVLRAIDVQFFSHKDQTSDPFGSWERLTVNEAFQRYADIDLEALLDERDALYRAVQALGIRVAGDDEWEDLFFRVMADKIEPHLGMGTPCILYEYPASMASLSRRKPDDPLWAERFELYVCGVELANAFSELTDAAEQRARFQEEMDLKEKLYGYRYPIDDDFLKALEHGLPESAGIALGLDRLVMLACGVDDIQQVQWVVQDV